MGGDWRDLRIRTLFAVVAAIALCSPTPVIAAGAAAPQVSYPFDIPRQPLADALRAFGRQTGTNLLFTAEMTAGRISPALSERLTAEEALRRLLEGSGLHAQRSSDHTVMLSPNDDSLTTGASSRPPFPSNLEAEASPKQVVIKGTPESQDDQVTITGARQIFKDGNVDMPRTVDDVQPYYIFDSQRLEQSGALNLEDFMKRNLTMNTSDSSSNQTSVSRLGNISKINLRGLGADRTLILVNGRRMAGVTVSGNQFQPDLNGIPLSAIERIEVLPSSASGIYGGGAIGGVINIVMKRRYSGSEIRVTNQNTWDTDAPTRSLSALFGKSFADGKTEIIASAFASESQPLLLKDRASITERGYRRILKNQPSYFLYYETYPTIIGATPNIGTLSGDLTLKGSHQSLGSGFATLPAGYTSDSDPRTIIPGQYNYDLPRTNQSPNGLLTPIGATPHVKAAMASLQRQVTESLDLYAEFSAERNESRRNTGAFDSTSMPYGVPSTAPTNPFEEDVYVSFPANVDSPAVTRSDTRQLTVGVTQRLGRGWALQGDFSASRNSFRGTAYMADYLGINADLASGKLNPFVDTNHVAVDLAPYVAPITYAGAGSVYDFAARASGPLAMIRDRPLTTTFALERRREITEGDGYFRIHFPNNPDADSLDVFSAQSQTVDSLYGEATYPVIDVPHGRRLMRSLDVQLAARVEDYNVDSGMNGAGSNAVFRHKSHYHSINPTVGLRYQPLSGLYLRASFAKAFVPPGYAQLLPNPLPDSTPQPLTDPATGATYDVQTRSGGNPALVPENSRSVNIGFIWEPGLTSLLGLRVSGNYYRITQFDIIGSISAQQIVDAESFQDRVTRDGTTGRISSVDTSLLNLTKFETEGWDTSIDWTRIVPRGALTLSAVATVIVHEKRQNTLDAPLLDFVGFTNEGGESRVKANGTLRWDLRSWTVGWSTQLFGSYKQNGAANDPVSAGNPFYIIAQGSDHISTQIYHDVFGSYAFGAEGDRSAASNGHRWQGLLNGLTVQAGIKNIFGTVPPFDAFTSTYFYSNYGDIRLREYWLSLRKRF